MSLPCLHVVRPKSWEPVSRHLWPERTLLISKDAFNCSNTRSNTVGLTVIDTSSNSFGAGCNVTVDDPSPPTARCVTTAVDVEINNDGTATINPEAINDGSGNNCNIKSKIASPPAFGCADKGGGPRTVTLTATDTNGKTNMCQASVNVVEIIHPDAIFKASFNAPLNASGGFTVGTSHIDNWSTDNCCIDSLAVSAGMTLRCGDLGAANPTSVTLTATDRSGLTDMCTTPVKAVDNMSYITCNPYIPELDDNGAVSIITASALIFLSPVSLLQWHQRPPFS